MRHRFDSMVPGESTAEPRDLRPKGDMNGSPADNQIPFNAISAFDTALIQSIIDNVPAAISIKDIDGRFILCNALFAQYHGLSTADQ
jgi:PAS domain-containing protein